MIQIIMQLQSINKKKHLAEDCQMLLSSSCSGYSYS